MESPWAKDKRGSREPAKRSLVTVVMVAVMMEMV
jgi:hypothetical protein